MLPETEKCDNSGNHRNAGCLMLSLSCKAITQSRQIRKACRWGVVMPEIFFKVQLRLVILSVTVKKMTAIILLTFINSIPQ